MKTILKKILSAIIVLFFGFWGIIFFFADYGPGETAVGRLAFAFMFFFVMGFFVHWLNYPKKRYAYFLPWALIIVFMLNFPTAVTQGSRVFFEAIGMIGVPFLAVFLSGKAVPLFVKPHPAKKK